MGLLDLTREVVTEYKADVSEHIEALDELEGKEAELAEAELERANAQGEQLESFLGQLGKVALAYEGIKEIGETLWDGYNEGIKEAQLETTAAGVNIEALSAAAGGLKTNMELLEFAAKANSSAFHNSQSDMETAEEAMRALEARGVPAAQAYDAVTGAMDNLKTKGLASLGIYVDTTKVSFDANGAVVGDYNQKLELHQKVMESLKAVAGEVADGQDKVGDSMKRAQVSLSDSWSELKVQLGQLVEAMQPLIESLAKAVGLVAKIAAASGDDAGGSWFSDVAGAMSGNAFGMVGRAGEDMITRNKISQQYGGAGGTQELYNFISQNATKAYQQSSAVAAQQQRAQGPTDIDMGGEEMNVSADVKKGQAEAREAYAEALGRQLLRSAYIDAGGDPNNTDAGIASNYTIDNKGGMHLVAPQISATTLGTAASTTNVMGASQTGGILGGKAYDTTDATGAPVDLIGQIQKQAADAQKLQYAQGETMLSKTFGKVGEFDLYKKGFEALTSTVGTMYDAIVSGSEPAAQAIKKAIGASVDAVGKQMAVEALKEAAYAIGDVAIGNFPGAESHALAAAEFAAGAVIAGVVARELGAGSSSSTPSGSSSSSGSSASSSTSSSSSATSSSSTTPTGPVIVYGDSFSDDSPRMRALKAQKLVNLATGTTSAGTSS